jgi:UDP-N-acetylmuramyl pentapeptide phosphotransferase/UDP-N-acetylglucosamine-1-phosphate transferase
MAASCVLLYLLLNVLRRFGVVGANFQGRLIPNRLGVFLWLTTLLYPLFTDPIRLGGNGEADDGSFLEYPDYGSYATILTFIFCAGWLDDSLGRTDIKGLRGHLKQLLVHKSLTTGLGKLVITAAAATWFVMQLHPAGWLAVPQIILISLSTNAVNLLDLRPGRALKAFFLISVITVVCSLEGGYQVQFTYMMPVMFGALLLFAGDVRGRWMLGDTGANYLGFALGCWLVMFAPEWLQLLSIGLLVYLHWYAEKSSITKAIEHNRVLQWIDRLGRV